jgi:glycosyltransferase involved in cell wall biosynthesis
MLHLFINAASASAGGGLTYVRNVLPCLAVRADTRVTAVVDPSLQAEVPQSANISVSVLNAESTGGVVRRLWYEQSNLPGIVRRSGADVLLSTGNFALYRSPVPQILLSRNALYLSKHFQRDLRERGDYRLWLDTEVKGWLARWSVGAADCTVAPSATFAEELGQWTGKNIMSIHHGFNHEAFVRDQSPLSLSVQTNLAATEGSLRLLFVSHYNYYRNFETLLRAIAILKKKLHPRPVRLLLTCKLNSKDNPGDYRADSAAALVEQLQIRDEVVELGSVPYASLHHLYRACDFYVTPAYAETFAHPLVEAMASGLPVIASDLAVHKEICGEAALYFPPFSPEDLAGQVVQASQSPDQVKVMSERGARRSRDFSWDKHVEELLQLARRLANRNVEAVA